MPGNTVGPEIQTIPPIRAEPESRTQAIQAEQKPKEVSERQRWGFGHGRNYNTLIHQDKPSGSGIF